MTKHRCRGWEIVCPDGQVRQFPYHNEGDAKSDARVCSKRGCELPPLFEHLTKCPQGTHTIRQIPFNHDDSN